MSQSWAVEFRPNDLDGLIGQKSVVKILERQLELGQLSHAYIFSGPSGCGKTTIARALNNRINDGKGNPEEIDGASNNGVDNVRAIIDSANERALDADYKVFIIDEAHMITTAGWNAFLKTIEEPPEYTIFMFCTTNPEKIPDTILNRCMRFNLTKIDTNLIKNRLLYIAKCKGLINYEESCDFISKLSLGGMRDGISMLEKCANYSNDLRIENVLDCLGDFSYDSFFDLTGAIYNNDEEFVLECISKYYDSGKDLKVFVDQYLEFCLNITKYCLFKNMNSISIPISLQSRCEAFSNVPEALKFANDLVNKILNIKNSIKYDTAVKLTVEAMFINICRSE